MEGCKMIKRFKPAQPDGSKTKFDLPDAYIGGIITIFVNGQMLYTQDDTDHPFGYTLDEDDKSFTFYTAPENDDFLYIMYDSNGGNDAASDYSGTGLMRLSKGYNVVSFMGKSLSVWNSDTGEVNYPTDILANVQNLIIDQIVYSYSEAGDNAVNIIREIQTYDDDTGKYRTYKPGATDIFWCGNGEHVHNEDLEKEPEDNDSQGSTIYYNPNNFILSKCLIDANGEVISGDADNSIEDLPSGLRQGIWIYVKEDADLSSTEDKLELWY
jgi:hypothetical protein